MPMTDKEYNEAIKKMMEPSPIAKILGTIFLIGFVIFMIIGLAIGLSKPAPGPCVEKFDIDGTPLDNCEWMSK